MTRTNRATGETTDTTTIRPFADWLRDQARGASHAELGESLHSLVEAVIDTQKGGTLTYTVTVKPMKGGDETTMVVTDEIRLKLPEHERGGSVFYADKHGNLTRTDPNQLEFESLREVPAATAPDELKEVTR